MSELSRWGRFDAAERTFVLEQDPPRKWRNVHTTLPAEFEMYAETSNLGDGPVSPHCSHPIWPEAKSGVNMT